MTEGDTMRKTIRGRLARGALLASLLLTSSCFAAAPSHAAAREPASTVPSAGEGAGTVTSIRAR